MSSSTEPENVVIIGGGIIGSSSAYFLSHHPSFDPCTTSITLLEATQIAGGASGKAGGLLALWAYPSSIASLSYQLHKELADKYDGAKRWGYREVHCGQVDCKGRAAPLNACVNRVKDVATAGDDPAQIEHDSQDQVSLQKRSNEAIGLLRAAGVPSNLDWLDPQSIRAYEEMGDPSTTAQVHPYLFTTSMAQLAEEKGVKIVYGSAKSIDTSTDGRSVAGVTYVPRDGGEEQLLHASHVILSAGPWTQRVWPKAPISALRAHSVTIQPTRPISAYALFTSIQLPKHFTAARTGVARKKGRGSSGMVTPEIYARPNNEVYACGEGDHLIPLPRTTALVEADESRCQDIVDYVGAISDELRDGKVTARQACYLPNVSVGGGPIIGESSIQGLIVAAGHTCWGIQNAPATGKLVSEIVFDGGPKCAKIGQLDPKRFGL
jgi:glycine/D-amino acid oxidase-like deaminating enzyme